MAKNGKAGTRITTAWGKGKVHKDYYCVVECSDVNVMIQRSTLLKKMKQTIRRVMMMLEPCNWMSLGKKFTLISKGTH